MSSCYISTAVFVALGHNDNDPMLVSLRNFRDTYMKSTVENMSLVKEYYNTAPLIVKAIETRPDSKDIFKYIYENYIVRAVKAIELGKNEIALSIYKKMYEYLKNLSGV